MTIKTKKQTSFKKRYTTKSDLSILNKEFKPLLLINRSRFRFEYIYFRFLKKWIKKIVSLKYKKTVKARIWFNITSNYPLTKKSKNSRMGKGKGSFLRWAILMPANSIVFEFFNIETKRVQLLVKKWNYTLSKKIILVKR